MLKSKLAGIKQGDSDMYSHLTTVLKQLILSNDRDGYQLFEHFSQRVKAGETQVDNHYREEELDNLKDFIAKAKTLLNKPNTGTEEEPAEPGPTGYVPNLMEEAKWFERAGVGFGEECTYLIFKSLERFSILKQVKELKFWGKIVCSSQDYYIAESPTEGGDQNELPPEVQPKGTGVNKMTYWVSNDLIGDWKELPIVTPDQITISRRIRYQFSGDLDRQIYTNPHFPGKQAHLLKCQVVRINFSCTLIPRTMYKVNEQDKKEIEPTQQWKMPGFTFLSSLENWVHHPQNILKNGRLALLKPNIPQGQEVDEQKLMKELEGKDPLQQRLKSVSQDQRNGQKLWAIRIHGDTCEYRAMSKAKQYVNYGFISLRSLFWKGWTLIYHNKQWSTMYIGNGFKSTDGWYYPQEPEMVFEENQDHEEVSEPNFPPEQQKKAQEDGDKPADEEE